MLKKNEITIFRNFPPVLFRRNRKQNGSTPVGNIRFFCKFYYLHILSSTHSDAMNYFFPQVAKKTLLRIILFFHTKLINKLVEAFKIFSSCKSKNLFFTQDQYFGARQSRELH